MKQISSGKSELYQEGQEMEKLSPFIYYPGMTYCRVRKRDCSNSEISRMIVNGILDERHDMIIKMLGKHGYLNSYLIRVYLEHISGGTYAYNVSDMRKMLKSLVGHGLLMQYEFKHERNGVVHGSPFIYAISGGGIRYLKKQGIKKMHPSVGQPFNLVDVFTIISTNQFHIRMISQYGKTPAIRMEDYYGECHRKTGAGSLYCINLADGSIFYIILLSVRKAEGWKQNFLKVLRKIRAYASERCIEPYAVFVICETEFMAMECARYKNCEAYIKDIDAFYLTDTSLVGEGMIFDRVIEVVPRKDYSTRYTFALRLKDK